MRARLNEMKNSDAFSFGLLANVLLVVLALSAFYFLSVGPFIWAWHKQIVTRSSPLIPVLCVIYDPIFGLADNNTEFAKLLVGYERLWGYTNWVK